MAFYTFRQNNSGGSFTFDDKLTVLVVVEANSAAEANDKFKRIGGYFNGVDDNGPDCPCCGDRWHRAYEPGDDVPMYYSTPLTDVDWKKEKWWSKKGFPEARVFYADGRIEEFGK